MAFIIFLRIAFINAFASLVLLQLSDCDYLENLEGANREELCIQETFKPSCPQGDVVFVSRAKYGRMNIGKCLSEKELETFGPFNKDPRYVGCFDEVSQTLNDKCSFKNNCEMRVYDLLDNRRLLESNACLPGLVKYLEVQYNCLSVLGSNGIENCKVTLPGKTTHLNPNIVTNQCKSMGNGLLIEAPKGQRIKFTIFHHSEFANEKSENWPTDRASCGSLMADIKDIVGKTNATVCQNGFLITDSKNQGQNFKTIFQTKSHLAEIMLLPTDETGNNYLLRLEVEGCLDIIPPEDTWLKRTNDDIVLGCYSSKKTWYLRCEGGKWSGTIGNCSHHSQNLGSTLQENDGDETIKSGKITMSENSQILIIIAICGFGLVICFVIVCLGMICLNRFKRKDVPIADEKIPGSMHYSTYCANPNFNGTVRPFNPTNLNQFPQLDESVDQERYQVLDKDEVAKESSLLADY